MKHLLLIVLSVFLVHCQGEKKQMVVMKTNLGEIELELYPDKAPVTVQNFVDYAKNGHYDGTIFHRVIANFMIQGGGFSRDLNKKETRPPIKNEADNGLKNKRGTIAMARTMDVNSATSQFFINTVDNLHLNHRGKAPGSYGYCVFGKVTKGMEVVDKIRNVPVENRGGAFANMPTQPVWIKTVQVK